MPSVVHFLLFTLLWNQRTCC